VKPDEILGAVGLINHLGKTCFVQGLHNERIQMIVRSRGETLLLFQAIEISLEEECAILSLKDRTSHAAKGTPFRNSKLNHTIRCNKCQKLGHTSANCLSSSGKLGPRDNVRIFGCTRDEIAAGRGQQVYYCNGLVGRDNAVNEIAAGRGQQVYYCNGLVGRDDAVNDSPSEAMSGAIGRDEHVVNELKAVGARRPFIKSECEGNTAGRQGPTCFKCGRKDHIARNCRVPSKAWIKLMKGDHEQCVI
jgi:hypothetical protein